MRKLILILVMLFVSIAFNLNAEAFAERDVKLVKVDNRGSEKIKIKNNTTTIEYQKLKSKEEMEIRKEILDKSAKEEELQLKDHFKYDVEELHIQDGYFYAILSSFPKKQTDDYLYPSFRIAVGKQSKRGWDVAIERVNSEYMRILNEIPNTLLNLESKKHFSVDTGFTTQSSTIDVVGLPWEAGTSWKLSQGPHSEESNRCCLDFVPPGGDDGGVVRAAEDGTKLYTSGICVFYKNGSHSLIYQHIDSDDISNTPNTIKYGELIGDTNTPAGCGYDKKVPMHVHFGYWDSTGSNGQPISGSVLNGWQVDYDSKKDVTTLTKGSDVKKVNDWILHDGTLDSCISPSSSDWIVTDDCEVPNNISLNNNLIIEDNASLTVLSSGSVNVNFSGGKKVIVKNGGKLKIKNSGKIF